MESIIIFLLFEKLVSVLQFFSILFLDFFLFYLKKRKNWDA